MKTLIFYNAKGGVGSTSLAAASCILLARAGVRVAGASLDANRNLRSFLARYGIPWFDATAELPQDEDLLVLDVRSTTEIAHVLHPTLWVMAMDNRTAYENAIGVMPELTGPALWVWNNVGLPEVTEGRPVPETLRSRVRFADQIILRDQAIAAAADRFELACSECSEAMRQLEAFVHATAARLGLTIDDAAYPKWRGTEVSAETPADITGYVHSHNRREHQAQERLRGFFER